MTFSQSKARFDTKYKTVSTLARSFCTVDGKFVDNVGLIDSIGEPNEEYYKWQFIYSLIDSGLVPRDYIGTEIYFPKGNIGSAPIKIDAVIFSDTEWIDHYRKYRDKKDQDSLNWLRNAAIFMIEFKREGDTGRVRIFV